MAPPPIPYPNAPDTNEAHMFIGASWTLFGISTVFFVARMYTRLRFQNNAGWDDWIMCLVWASVLAFQIMFNVYLNDGGARHAFYLSPHALQETHKYGWLANLPAIIALNLGKMSVALLLQRLLPSGTYRWHKIFLRGCFVTAFLVMISITVVLLRNCYPLESMWNPNVKGTCWDMVIVGNWNYFTGSLMAFLDFALALFPILIVKDLNMSLRKRMFICCLLGMGVMTGVCAVVKTIHLPALLEADFTWNTATFLMWNSGEANVIIIAASIPTLRPLGRQIVDLFKYGLYGKKPNSTITGDDSRRSGNSRKAGYLRQKDDFPDTSMELDTIVSPGSEAKSNFQEETTNRGWTTLSTQSRMDGNE